MDGCGILGAASPRFLRALATLAVGGAAWAAAAPALADALNAFKVVVSVNGSTPINVHGGGPAPVSQGESTQTVSGVTTTLSAAANQFVAAKSSVSGNATANALVRASAAFNFKLAPPGAGANVVGGKVIVKVALEGKVAGDADLHMVGSLDLQGAAGTVTGSATLAGASQRTDFEMAATVSPNADAGDLQGRVRIFVDATSRLAGGGAASSSAEATSGTRVVGFRVLNASGVQVSGFTMTAEGGSIAELPAAAGGDKSVAIEYFNAGFGHYFVTASTNEIAKLDNGTFAGWTRTGKSFNVGATAAAGLVPVCRFFTVAFPPTSSHFYAPRGLGCEGTLTNARWQFEGEVFYMALPDATGNCPSGTVPVYRLYNNGKGGAPNHRFTTEDATRKEMLAAGYVAEGAGVGIGMCAPQ